MTELEILTVRDEDIEQCAKIIRKAFINKAIEYGFTKENYPSSGAFIQAETLFNLKSKGVLMFAAWVRGKIVGYVQLAKKEEGVYSFQKFSVLPKYQQFGIGRALINFCKNKVAELGGNKISLIMVEKNEELKNFYLSNDFILVKTISDTEHPFVQAVMEFAL